MRVKIIFSYDGSKFNGFQRLNKERTIQKEIETALTRIFNEKIEIKGSGRTDAKVHADNQVAHFDINEKHNKLKQLLNNELLPDIFIKKLSYVDNNFHARKSSKKKEYIYKINLGPYKASLNDYYFQPNYKLDISLMKEASRYLIGTHDFHNFVSGQRNSYITTIYSITFVKTMGKLEIHFIGAGFYRYMVRNLVGALLEIGKYKERMDILAKMLDNLDISITMPTAPAEGLYLHKVWY